MKNRISFGSNGDLMCPYCGSTCLHQESCTAYWRQEDSEIGVVCRSSIYGVTAKNGMEKNPSSRRDGIRIAFSCEMCPAEPSLVVVQHKGSTLLEWE